MWVSVSQQGQGNFFVKCLSVSGTIPISSVIQAPPDDSLLVPILTGVLCFLCVLFIGTVVFLRRRCCLATTSCSRGGGNREMLEMGYLPANITVNREAVERGVPDAFLRNSDTFSQRTSHGSLSGADVMETVAAYLRSAYPYRSSTADPQVPIVSSRKSTSCPNVLHVPQCGLTLAGEGHVGGARSQPLEVRLNPRDSRDYFEIINMPTRSGDSSPVGAWSFYGDSWSNADDTYTDKPGKPGLPQARDTRQTLSFGGMTNPRITLEDCAPVTGVKSTSAKLREGNNGMSSDAVDYYNTRVEPDTSEYMTLRFIGEKEDFSSDHKASETHVYDTATPEKSGFFLAPYAGYNEESSARNGTVTKAASSGRLTQEASAEDVKRPDNQCLGHDRPQQHRQIPPLHYESVVLDSSLSAAGEPSPASGFTTSGYQTDPDGRLTVFKESEAQQKRKKRQEFFLVGDNRTFYDHISHSGENTYSSLNRQVRRQEVIDNVYSKSNPHLTHPAPAPSPILTYTAPDPPPS
ncbi:uncharacterized protein LOC112566778 [Pomacea canaliculata]|uniref:uncharacterized protein LOC112566778 n=1 Tax=Pomacea canaliculata TaxID=400727 RepID=UPI000D73F9AC|nr:uncharacterized protein LOC112566778 [Pomacea canaliculata]